MHEPTPPQVRLLGEPTAVPVFNCRILIAPQNAAGQYLARAAELPGVGAMGNSQREAIQGLVAAFKARMAAHVANGEEIPWSKPGEQKQPGEQELFTAVHL